MNSFKLKQFNNFKQLKFFSIITLFIQGITFFALAASMLSNKRNFSKFLLTLAAASGTAGSIIFYKLIYENMPASEKSYISDERMIYQAEIPIDDTVNEDEFI